MVVLDLHQGVPQFSSLLSDMSTQSLTKRYITVKGHCVLNYGTVLGVTNDISRLC